MFDHHIEIHDLPLHTPFAIASGTMETAQCVILALRDDCGNIGLGEAAPFSAVSGEELDQTAARIDGFFQRHKGANPIEALRANKEMLAEDPSALCAIECALIDLIARQYHTPLWRMFGSPAVRGAPRVQTDITVPVMKPTQVRPFLDRFKDHQFPVYKVKVSGDLPSDIESVLATHQWGSQNLQNKSFRILLDGNQGYRLDSARKLLSELEGLGIHPACFEQPLPKDNWKDLASLTASCATPVLLDESVSSAADVAHAARLGAGRMINIKITKSGVIESLRMIAAARALGMGMMIGGMVETEIAMGFSLHMVAGLASFAFIDLDTPFFLEYAMTAESPWIKRSSQLELPVGSGLGLHLDASHRRTAEAEQETDPGLVIVTS